MELLNTVEEFKEEVTKITSSEGYRKPIMFGICRNDMGVINPDTVLQSTFLVTNVGTNDGSAAIFSECVKRTPIEQVNVVHDSHSEAVYDIDLEFLKNTANAFTPFIEEAEGDKHLNVQAIGMLDKIHAMLVDPSQNGGNAFGERNYTFRIVFIYEDAPVETVEAGYLKLYALSEGKAPIRSLNLNGLFGKLTRCAWTVNGEPIELEALESRMMELKTFGQYPAIDSVDKFPRMLQHVIPSENVRILDSSKVRMGAQLAAGTVVMPGASYINFNAGTEGPVMVEGRISSSAVVGAGSDIGGGASILGVLSGTDGDPITVGKNCLLGANSVCGIPLGDACIVDAGVTILPGTKVTIDVAELDKLLLDNVDNRYLYNIKSAATANEWIIITVKASELVGTNGIHFRSDSTNGSIVAFRSVREITLNEDLH
jgi:2,3,4,5-tetrahydropyridine-2-carboxylate N-succinyltransferase